MTNSEFQQQAQDFLNHLFSHLLLHQIPLQPHWPIDHLCYRVNSVEKYENLKNEFSNFSKLLIESEVNGRLIATFKLNEPIVFKNYKIDVAELPAPKIGKKTIEGFEHAEVVCDISFEQLKKSLQHCKLDESGLSKLFNKELEVQLDSCAIKFHHISLESVIELEKSGKIKS